MQNPRSLKLERPLVCLDLETTGTDTHESRIVQIALVRLEPDGRRDGWCSLVNPGVSIPASATAIHGITNADVGNAPTLRELLPEIERRLGGADLAGFNSIRFDQPLLRQELRRAGSALDLFDLDHVDAQVIYHRMEPRNLGAAYLFYCGQELEGAHDALADAEATLDVVLAQIGHYPQLPEDVPSLNLFCRPDADRYLDPEHRFSWVDGEATVNFGRYRDRPLRHVAEDDPEFLRWILRGRFSGTVKAIASEALAGNFPEPAPAPKDPAGDTSSST